MFNANAITASAATTRSKTIEKFSKISQSPQWATSHSVAISHVMHIGFCTIYTTATAHATASTTGFQDHCVNFTTSMQPLLFRKP